MERDNRAGIPHRQRPEHQRVHETEHRRVGANAQRERKHGDQREAGTLPQSPKRVAKVSHERAHERSYARSPLKVPAESLFPLNRLEKRAKIALAEAATAFSLDHFIEQSGAILYRTREDLQHVAFIVAIDQNA